MKKVDEINMQIIEMLKENGRATYSEIAKEVHLSRVAVRDRIIQMVDSGVIVEFTVQISSKALGKPVSIFLDIEVEPKFLSNIALNLAKRKDIAIVSQHTGATGLHVHAYIDKIENISSFIENNVYCLEGVKNVHINILIKNYKTNPWLC